MKEPLEEYKYQKPLDLNRPVSFSEELIKIHCPSCKEEVNTADIELRDKLAKCNSCNGIFSFKANRDIAINNRKDKILQPEGIEIFHFQNELDISFQHTTGMEHIAMSAVVGLLGLELLAFGILGDALIALYLSIPVFIAAIFFIIKFIAARKNKIYITIDDQYLSVLHRPYKFSFPKDQYFKISDVDQIYIKKNFIYAIINTPNGQKHVKLTPMIKNKSKVHYIEQEIERHLGIVDRVVPEEDK